MHKLPLHIWQSLTDGSHDPLIEAAQAVDDFSDVRAIQNLRRLACQELVTAAIELALGRKRLANKVNDPTQFLADSEAAEQATPLPIAHHKAQRFADAGVQCIADLCCGMGLDGVALGQVAPVTLFDLDPTRTWMALTNAGAMAQHTMEAKTQDVTDPTWDPSPFDAFHMDPTRRTGQKRIWQYEQLLPPPDFFEPLARKYNLALKLSPAVDFECLPAGHVELIARGHRLNQAVLWTGRLAFAEGHLRTVTRLDPDQAPVSWTAEHNQPIPTSGLSELQCDWLCLVDPAVERAGLMGALCQTTNLKALHPSLGLLTSQEAKQNSWLRPYRHIATMPWRLDHVQKWCRDHAAGEVTVKTRNRAVQPDVISKQLRGKGDERFTVFVLNHGQKRMAHITLTPDP